MNDPQPLIYAGASEFEARLLRAGQSDELPSSSRRRIFAGLGIGGGILSATTIASGVKATGAKGLLSTLGLGGAVGAVGAVAVWAGIATLAPSTKQPSQPAPVHAVVPVRAARVVVPAPVAIPPAETAPLPAPKAAVVTRAPERTVDSLALELSALEQARAALAARDYSLALRSLDDYSRRFPKRRLDSEASVLRIETLAARGDRLAAARVGNQFLASHPNGPYARRVKSLIGEGDGPAKSSP